jgi:hypothetical protein
MARQWLRLRIWMLMALVGVSGVAMGGGAALKRRRDEFHRTASFHRERVARIGYGDSFGVAWFDSRGRFLTRPQSEWHAAMAAKYEYAADHPWLRVEPDPPMPGPGDPDPIPLPPFPPPVPPPPPPPPPLSTPRIDIEQE